MAPEAPLQIRDFGGQRAAVMKLEQAHRFRYLVRNDDVARATEALAALVERELAFAATMTT